jgi:hypothetical protein
MLVDVGQEIAEDLSTMTNSMMMNEGPRGNAIRAGMMAAMKKRSTSSRMMKRRMRSIRKTKRGRRWIRRQESQMNRAAW